MPFDYHNFLGPSSEIIRKSMDLAIKSTRDIVKPSMLFISLYDEAKDMVDEIFDNAGIQVAPIVEYFNSSIDKMTDRMWGDSTFSKEATLTLLKASCFAMEDNSHVATPIHILQALLSDVSIINPMLYKFKLHVLNLNHSIEEYKKSHTDCIIDNQISVLKYSLGKDYIMRGWGFDVSRHPNLTEFQSGILINALEEYCFSNFIRPFSGREKTLLAKVDGYHIGWLAKCIKSSLKNEPIIFRRGKLAGGDMLKSNHANWDNESSISISEENNGALNEKIDHTKEQGSLVDWSKKGLTPSRPEIPMDDAITLSYATICLNSEPFNYAEVESVFEHIDNFEERFPKLAKQLPNLKGETDSNALNTQIFYTRLLIKHILKEKEFETVVLSYAERCLRRDCNYLEIKSVLGHIKHFEQLFPALAKSLAELEVIKSLITLKRKKLKMQLLIKTILAERKI